MKFCESMKLSLLKIIIIIIGYILNNFHYSYHNIIVNYRKDIISNFKNEFIFEKNKIFILSMWKHTLGYGMCKDQCHVGRMHFFHFCNVSKKWNCWSNNDINGKFIFHFIFFFFSKLAWEKKCAIICHHRINCLKELRLTSKGLFILNLNVNNFDRLTSYLQCLYYPLSLPVWGFYWTYIPLILIHLKEQAQ
jgi:hypothetical protein